MEICQQAHHTFLATAHVSVTCPIPGYICIYDPSFGYSDKPGFKAKTSLDHVFHLSYGLQLSYFSRLYANSHYEHQETRWVTVPSFQGS